MSDENAKSLMISETLLNNSLVFASRYAVLVDKFRKGEVKTEDKDALTILSCEDAALTAWVQDYFEFFRANYETPGAKASDAIN